MVFNPLLQLDHNWVSLIQKMEHLMQFVSQFNRFIERIALNSSTGNKEKQYAIYKCSGVKSEILCFFPEWKYSDECMLTLNLQTNFESNCM